jgi:nucleoside-diphosphate-sugar epimerase
VSDLTSLPDTAWHRDVDKIVLAAASDAVKTAIVAPPTIYGPGRGPGNKRSQQVYQLALATLKTGQAPQLGKGLTEWDNVHVHDLSDIFLKLAEAAAANKKDDTELWGQKGYFLAEHGHHVWGEVAKQIGEVAFKKGYIKTKEVKIVTAEEAQEIGGGGAITWGLNSKGYAKRARKFLGWTPKGKSLKNEIPDIVDLEAASLGLKVGYAEKASGAK